jgi:hypothetical protein
MQELLGLNRSVQFAIRLQHLFEDTAIGVAHASCYKVLYGSCTLELFFGRFHQVFNSV